MYREAEYYRFVQWELNRYRFNRIDARFKAVLRRKIEKEVEWLDYNYGIIGDCESLIKDKIVAIVPFHAMLYKYIRKDLKLDPGKELVQMGITYTLLGCVIDKLIDSNTFIKRKPYVEILKEFKLGEDFTVTGEGDIGILCDLLRAVNKEYNRLARKYPLMDEKIKEVSKRAIDSEIFVSEHNLFTMDEGTPELVTDKSDKFTVTGILLACMDVDESMVPNLLRFSREIGNIMLIIDDLSDLYEDVGMLQINSLMYKVDPHIKNICDIEDAIDQIINSAEEFVVTLDLYVSALPQYLSVETIDFVRFVIVNWLGNVINFSKQVVTSESSGD